MRQDICLGRSLVNALVCALGGATLRLHDMRLEVLAEGEHATPHEDAFGAATACMQGVRTDILAALQHAAPHVAALIDEKGQQEAGQGQGL